MSESPAFVIEDHTPEPTANEYDDAVKALIEAGPDKRVSLPPVAVEDVKKARRRFAEAANRADRSPKIVSETPSEDGKTVTLRYRLTDKRAYTPRDKGDEKPAEADKGK